MSDLIDREAVREFIKSYRHSTDVAFHMEDHLDDIPAASPWHRAEEPPKEDGKYVAINVNTKWWYEASYDNGNWKAVDLFGKRWVVIHPTHWMPIEPPKEDA